MELLVSLLKFIPREKDRFENDSWPLNSILIIQGMVGIGKTTIAASITSSTDIRQTFHQICFIDLSDKFIAKGGFNNVTYSMYVNCLQDLYRQIGIPSDLLHEELVFFPGDTPLATAARSLQAIEKAKEEMSRLMNRLKVFIVLDDVWCHENVDLFNFGEIMETSFALFVTTRTLDMFPSAQACWIDIPLLQPADAVNYLFGNVFFCSI
mmetsp:Transcript_17859/g.35657  ORF Transcript_17859/g.35657 Transcript_17859/m.35657 type:complete len:209 (+) Transcript_17859:579-1205(+)